MSSPSKEIDSVNEDIVKTEVTELSTNVSEDKSGEVTKIKNSPTKVSPKNQTEKMSHSVTSLFKALNNQTSSDLATNGTNNPEKLSMRQVMSMNLREVMSKCAKNKLTKTNSKSKNMTSVGRKNSTSTSDAFPFLRQTSSGRVVKRTQLASVNTKEFWVDRPLRAKSTSPKQMNEKMSIVKYLNQNNSIPVKTNSSKNVTRRNSTGSLTNPAKADFDVRSIKMESEEICTPNSVPDGEIPTAENELVHATGNDEIKFIDKSQQVEMMSIEDTAQSNLLRVKLDHDYDEKKPVLPISFSEKDDIEVSDNNVSRNDDEEVKEISSPCTQDVKIEIENVIKREESGRNRKKTRLSSEVRTLIDESIKATKTLNFPTSRLRKPRTKLRNKQRRTECEMLLDMLTENPGPDNLIRVKSRNLPKQIVSCTHSLKNTPKGNNKIQKLPSPKVKEEEKNDGNVSVEESPIKARDKKMVTPLVAMKKNKAIKMKLKLEKKKKSCVGKDMSNLQVNNDAKNSEIGVANSSKPFKTIVLEDLKEKVKAKMEKTGNTPVKKSSELKLGQFINYYRSLTQRRPPGRPRIHHNPQLPKPAKVSRHGRILGRPKKTSDSKLSSGDVICANTLTTNPAVSQTDYFLNVPYISLPNNCMLQSKLMVGKNDAANEKTCDVEVKDYSRQRSSQRQAESSYKYKDIAVKFHNNFAQIILLFSQTNPKTGLNPQVFKELKRALLATWKDNNCKVVLLNGIGSIFCSGIDLTYLVKDNKEQRQKVVAEMVTSMRDFLRTLISFPKPVVLAINGLARGLGVGLLLLCDIIYASDKAIFEMPYSQIGQVPEGCASLTLPRNLSFSMANDLLFAGRRLTAAEAHQCGLVSQVFWPNDLLEQVIPRVQKMASQNRHVMETTKALLRQKMKCELEASLEDECQLLMNQWCQPECQKSMKEFIEQPLP